MTMPFYMSPEQVMRDRSDYAKAGIAKGRAAVAVSCRDGICLVAENPSTSLCKISEIYDRLAFAAAGCYNEFELLRIAGIRHADLRGFTYDRADVTGRSLANAYSQLLGGAFASGSQKPYEVDLLLTELGRDVEPDQLFRVSFDGSIKDSPDVAVVGGDAVAVSERIRRGYAFDQSATEACANVVTVLADGRAWTETRWEVAILDRHRTGRTFRHLDLPQFLGESWPK